jgi:hypothetical protein
VGKRPQTPLYEELFPWENATIELPDDVETGIEFIEELLKNKPLLETIHKRNYLESLARNDWRHRLKQMFEILEIPLPQPLKADLEKLNQLYLENSPKKCW